MPNPKRKIVLIEDDAVLSEMYYKKFSLDNYQIERAMDGESGLALIKKIQPDIVLLDIMMPKMNGLDTLRAMKADAKLKDVYVVLLTNVGEQSYVDEGFRLGANQYLMKSNYTPKEIVAKVEEWLSAIDQER